MIHRLVGAVVGAVLLTACGIPADHQPRRVSSVPTDITGTPEASVGGTHAPNATVYFVAGKELVAVRRPLPTPLTAAALVETIAAGPTPQEQAAGLRTALTTSLEVAAATVDRGGHLTIKLSHEPAETGAAEQVLAFGQVVLTLITLPSIRSVRFTVDRHELPVPRGDGSLTTEPLTREDYHQLMAAPTRSP